VPKLKKQDVISDISRLTERSPATLRRIIINGCVSPKKTKVFKARFDYNNSDYDKIDSIITDFNKNKILPSINDVFNTSKTNSNISFKKCGRTTFYKLFKKMGYKYEHSKKIIRSDLMNKIEIKRKRIKYLIEKRRIEKQSPNSEFVYIDETFVHKNYVKYKVLQPLNKSKRIRFKMSVGKGTRYSIIHAGSENGFIPGAEHIIINSAFNSLKFEDWLKNKLLPNFAPNSVVILDNATTHSKQYNKPPVQSSNVKTIKNWLDINNIYYNNSANKQELLKIVKENNFYVQHTVDEIILNAGHIPLRLPPYHCELNPIELVWAQLKKIIAKHNFNNNSIEF
jgi:transposase